MSWRLLAVSVLAIAMGLVFGGLRVASATNSAASFGRVSQLASLGQQDTVLVQALENERDQTTGIAPDRHQPATRKPSSAYDATRRGRSQRPDAGRQGQRLLPGQHPGQGGHRAIGSPLT